MKELYIDYDNEALLKELSEITDEKEIKFNFGIYS